MSQSKRVPSRAPGLSFQTACTSVFPDFTYAPTQKLPSCSNQKPWSRDDSFISSTSHIHWDSLSLFRIWPSPFSLPPPLRAWLDYCNCVRIVLSAFPQPLHSTYNTTEDDTWNSHVTLLFEPSHESLSLSVEAKVLFYSVSAALPPVASSLHRSHWLFLLPGCSQIRTFALTFPSHGLSSQVSTCLPVFPPSSFAPTPAPQAGPDWPPDSELQPLPSWPPTL